MGNTSIDPLNNAAIKRVQKVARENWEYAAIGGAVVLVVSVITLLITRAIIRRRRRTFWQRVLDYLEDLGEQGERVVDRLKDLYDENIDTDAIAKSVNRKVKSVEKELKSLDDTVSDVKERGRKFARRVM